MIRKILFFINILAWVPFLAFAQGTLTISGSAASGATEQDILSGGRVLVLSLSGGATWKTTAADNASPWKLVFTPGSSFGNVTDGLTNANLEFRNDTAFIITFPITSSYLITADETISIAIPDNLLATGSSLNTVSFDITDLDPMVSLSGSLTAAAQEYTIRSHAANSLQLVLTVKYDTWYSNFGKNNAVTDNFLAGITGDQDWASVILNDGNLVRDNATTATLTIPNTPDYTISSNETVTIDIPAEAFDGSAGSVINPAFTIFNQQPAVSASWNSSPLIETMFRTGDYKLTLNITSNDEWVSDTTILKTNFTTGLNGNSEWNTKILPGIYIQSHNNTSVVIGFAGNPGFDINTSLNISYNIPDNTLKLASGDMLNTTPATFTVTPAIRSAVISPGSIVENSLNGGFIDISLQEETFSDFANLAISDFSLSIKPTTTSITSVTNKSATSARLYLSYSGDIDINGSLQVTILNRLSGGGSLVSNSINVIAVLEPVITGVTIPNKAFKINDNVPVTISVQNDGGQSFALTSGSVSNRTLTGFTRQNNTTYNASFKILSGEPDFPADANIPVSVQLEVVGRPGNLFTIPVIQGNDLLDANAPSVATYQALGTVYKIGDFINLIATADAAGYTIDSSQTRINGVSINNPSFSFLNESGGSYYLSYQVTVNDLDVTGVSPLTGQIALKDFAGNVSNLRLATAVSASFRIDAHPPVISSVTAPDSFYVTGETLTLSITTDGTAYSLSPETFINGISATSGRFSFNGTGPVYTLNYPIQAGDAAVSAGNLPVNIIISDAAGNKSSALTSFLNNAEIYTTKPTATISGTNSICEGDSSVLYFTLTGKKNWNIIVNDGTTNYPFNGITSSPFSFKVAPSVNKSYTISSVSDNSGLSNSGNGVAVISINPSTPVSINPIASAYNIESSEVPLSANIAGGVFSGPGVIGSTNYFYPSLAGVLNSPHTIVYTYTNSYGCKSTANLTVSVVEASGLIIIDKLYCYNSPAFNAQAVTDSVEIIGKFQLKKNDVVIPNGSGIQDMGNNFAAINPALLVPGEYQLLYKYFLKDSLSLDATFTVENVDKPKIIPDLPPTICENELVLNLQGDAKRGTFSGIGVIGNSSTGFKFDPAGAGSGTYTLTYTDTTVNGCKNFTKDTLQVFYVPEMGFSASDNCVTNTGTEILFTNSSANKDSVSNWNWNFDDVNSGASNNDTTENPSHLFKKSGKYSVLLAQTTNNGCTKNLEITFDLGDKPTGKFDVLNRCMAIGVNTEFESNYFSNDGIKQYLWIITLPGGEIVKDSSLTPNRSYPFTGVGDYTVYHKVTANSDCSIDTTAIINLSKTQKVFPGSPFIVDFNIDSANWNNTGDAYWRWTKPGYAGLGADLSNAWCIRRSNSNNTVLSSLESNCYDLSELERPMIKMDIFRNFITSSDATIIETSTDNGTNWSILGSPGDGINWYSDFQTTNFAFGTNYGWANTAGTSSDSGWVEARHILDPVAGSSNVQFRLVFGAKPSTIENYEGFAVRKITIGERSRVSALEHFTNTTPLNPVKDRAISANAIVDELYKSKNGLYKDFVKLEYHTRFPSANDPLNIFNRDVPGARAFYYGITSIPFSLLDGGDRTGRRFDFTDTKFIPREVDINLRSLTDPAVDIKVSTVVNGNELNINVKLKALQNLPAGERVLYVVIYESLVTDIAAENGVSLFRNVVRNMIPDAGGTGINQALNTSPQTAMEYNFVADISNLNKDRVRVAAYLQNDFTGEIYQVGLSDYTFYQGVGVNPTLVYANEISLYPNPAKEFVELKISGKIEKLSMLEFYDQLGRKVFSKEILPFEISKVLSTSGLNKGVYYVRITSAGIQHSEVKKLVIME